MASSYLRRIPANGGNRKTWTWSGWVKRANLVNGSAFLFSCNGEQSAISNYSSFYFSNNSLEYYDYTGGSPVNSLITSAVYRDTSAWYHIVCAYDSTQATSSNRIKFFVNGLQITNFSATAYPSLNYDSFVNVNSSYSYFLGTQTTNLSGDFSGSMADVYFIDGIAYDASTFGSFDSTTGIWKPNTAPTVTYGTNGFNLKFTNGADAGEDFSGNNNDFATNGTPTQTLDCPSNVFATLNPLLGTRYSTQTFSNGNTTVAGGAGHEMHMSTLAFSKGKYYYEAKLDAIGNYPIIGAVEAKNVITNNKDINTYGYGWFFNGNVVKLGSTVATYNSYTTGDILGVAVDADNKEIYFSKNGTWQNSSNPASGTNPAITGILTDDLMIGVDNYGSTWSANFGNGFFGTTAVVSAGTNAGIGTFEYDVPAGYYALCTKNINTQEYS